MTSFVLISENNVYLHANQALRNAQMKRLNRHGIETLREQITLPDVATFEAGDAWAEEHHPEKTVCNYL